MSYTGILKNGVVVLPPEAQIPEGARVGVTVPLLRPAAEPAGGAYAALAEFVGAFEGLPPDLARNHDHYLHGTPQR